MLVVPAKTIRDVYPFLVEAMKDAPQVKTERWQGMDVRNNPAAVSYELQNVVMEVPLDGVEAVQFYAEDIGPNLPWADDHFKERVGGHPLNPGEEWKNWPWGKSAAKFRDQTERFNHSYAERLWPKFAREAPGGILPVDNGDLRKYPVPVTTQSGSIRGIGHTYGDLQDLVELLAKEPHTRQAWIPLFFPEDTGYGDGGRKPCTLGYQFMVRDGRLSVWYPLRSCDLIRHFRDDVYLAIRLMLWVLDECRKLNTDVWTYVKPGSYAMHVTSLHVFENDKRNLR